MSRREWSRGMRKIEVTSFGASTSQPCAVCGKPFRHRVVENGEIVERGETVWFETWSVKPAMHLACCDAKGQPLK